MIIENEYSSVACNRTPESMDWGKNNLILYGSCNAVSLFEPQYNNNSSSKIIRTFVRHTGRVNTVKWIINNSSTTGGGNTEFISGSDDKLCLIWKIKDVKSTSELPTIYELKGHTGGVTVVETIYVNDTLTVATASTDSTIKLWHFDTTTQNFVCFQTMSLGNGLCFAIRMSVWPKTNCILMCVATDDDKIHLYAENVATDRQFIKVDTLIGHEDWVRGLDIIMNDNAELIVASSSQDTFIRLWKISPRRTADAGPIKQSIKVCEDDEEIKIEEKIIGINTHEGIANYAISLESVLLGHDGWVYSVHWNRKTDDGQLQLLSSSIDKTMILWQLNDEDIWMEKIRVGDVGGNSLGFFGGKISSTGKSIIGHGYQGSFHMWHQDKINETRWVPGIVVGGHFGEVRDLTWDPRGQYLLTVSADQTTRIHVEWKNTDDEKKDLTWHELARPQVHGYDMQTICHLDRYRFASGAEEKIVRTFQAPGNFIENLRRIRGLPMIDETDPEGNIILQTMSKGASVPSLGLSNKAVNEHIKTNVDTHVKDEYPENYFVPSDLEEPPPEETLMQNTLWPEIQKLYGHGYEVFALCATSDGKLLASSCKATTVEHAQIILWNTTTWKVHQKLLSHQLTITQMKFSPDNKFLLSVSRDRRWTLFENQIDSENTSFMGRYNFKQISTTDKKNGIHSRIIWTCDWTHDSEYFATGSREGVCVLWKNYGDKLEADTVHGSSSLGNVKSIDIQDWKESITALAFSRGYLKNEIGNYLLAIGFDNGKIHLYHTRSKSILIHIDTNMAHHLTVRKLEFRPILNNNEESVELASCGNDHFVRIYRIKF